MVNTIPSGWTPSTSPRALFLGTGSAFSRVPLEALLRGGVDVCAVVVPASRTSTPDVLPVRIRPPGEAPHSRLPLLTPSSERTVVQVAWEHGIEVLEVGSLRHPATLTALSSHNVDVLCVACFPWRLPSAVLELPRLGCLNVHPSLLPEYRGPAPLFWVLRNGEESTGVSVHLMTEELDAGPILAQQEIPIPDGILGEELDRVCSKVGAELLLGAVRGLAAGTAAPFPQRPGGSYHGWPERGDFEVPTDRPARWAYRFIRGVSDWGTPPEVVVGVDRFRVRAARSYNPDGTLPQPWVRKGSELWVQFNPGVLHIELL